MYYEKSIEFAPLYKAMKICSRNLRWKDSVVGYEANGLRNTYRLRQDLLNGTYTIGKYQRFKIHEPKERDIIATRFRDRQFQMAMCRNGLYDDFVEHYIKDNPACQTGKGTDFALDRLTEHLRRYYVEEKTNEGYVLKCDIKHFFPNTDHEIAKECVHKYIKDETAKNHVCKIIDSFGGNKGIGLGSQISQLVELCVLTDLDHFVKERLRVKHYIRYMDDMILIHKDKDFLKKCKEEIENFLNEKKFELNQKTKIYKLSQGVVFMNWRFCLTPTGRIVRKMPKEKLGRQRRKMKRLWQKELEGAVEHGTTETSLQCWLANAKRGDTFYQRKRMIQYFNELTGGKYDKL